MSVYVYIHVNIVCVCVYFWLCVRRSSGVSRDIIKREIEALKETEHQLRKNVGRMFRRRRGFSFQRIAEFFKPTSDDKMERGRRLGRRWTLKNPRKLFSSTGDPPSSIPEHETSSELPHHQHTRTAVRHTRTLSDISEHQKLLRDEESSSPSLTPSGNKLIINLSLSIII